MNGIMYFFRCKPFKGIIVRAALLVPLILANGCGPKKVDTEFIRKMNQTKSQCSASVVRKAALQIVFEPGVSPKIPTEISSLPFFSKGDIYATPSIRGGEPIMFVQGGGFAHQGIIVCSSNATITNRLLHGGIVGTVVRWDDGVFFWADWRVSGVPKKDITLKR